MAKAGNGGRTGKKIPGPEGDITGVTWWTRALEIPASASPRRILLRFEAVRQRAEVYVNQKLVGYDMIGNTPFEVDLSNAVKPGDTAQLAVRITDPGGNFDWHDKGLIDWGQNQILFGHGFGGITGRIKMIVCDPVYVDDIYVQNLRAITDVNANITLRLPRPRPRFAGMWSCASWIKRIPLQRRSRCRIGRMFLSRPVRA